MNTPSMIPSEQLYEAILLAALELHAESVIQFDEGQIDATIETINRGPIYSVRITLQAGLRHLTENGLMEIHCTSVAGAEQQGGPLYNLTEKGLREAGRIRSG